MILTIDQYASKCKVTGETIRKRIRKGIITCTNVPKSSRVGIDTTLYPINRNGRGNPGRPRKLRK